TGGRYLMMPRKHFRCTYEGCEREHHARGLCRFHHRRWLRDIPLDAPQRQVPHSRPIVDGKRQCYACNHWKPVEEMLASRALCKPCKRLENQRYRGTAPEQVREVQTTSALLGSFFRGMARAQRGADGN